MASPRAAIEVYIERGTKRESVLEALTRGVTEGLPAKRPRGGTIWAPRYFVRRTAWHSLDHAWEIEDRSQPEP